MMLDDFFDFDTARARTFLKQDGDQKFMALISETHLLIIAHGKRHLLSFDQLVGLYAEEKKMLFPLIVGGVLAPFAFISFFVHPMQPWIHLIAIIIGLILLYIGWNGKPALVVKQKNHDELLVYLPAISINLRAFMDFTNENIHRRDDPFNKLIFIEDIDECSKWIFENDTTLLHKYPVYGFTYSQLVLRKEKNIRLIGIDPLTGGREIKFEYDTFMQILRPVIDGPLNPEARRDIPEWIKY